MRSTVFFSWQNDRPTREGRNLIEKALKNAVANIAQDAEVEEVLRGVEVDKDTKDVPGSPPIFDTILAKIIQAAVFVPDLTFVGTRSGNKPTPNPNVLIEYGYALKALGHARIIAVMNEAYGGPEALPFDLAHHRFPITYNLPKGAPDAKRQEVRKELTRRLEAALRTYFKSEEFKATLPKAPTPPPFPGRDPKNGKARFRLPNEALGVGDPVVAEVLGLPPEKEIYLRGGPAMWLRLMPTSHPGRTWLIRDLQEAALALAPLPLIPFADSLAFVRGEDGGGYYPSTGSNEARAVVYVFDTGEVWAVNTFPSPASRQIILEENRFTKSLEDCANFLDRLGIPGPYRWIVGMEGIQGFSLAVPGINRRFGPCVSDVIEQEGIYEKGDNVAELLRPFFDKVFDQCGVRRPQNSP